MIYFYAPISLFLSLVRGSRNIPSTAGPVDVDILAYLVLGAGELGLDSEGVSAEVITLSLEQVCRQILGAVTIKPGQGSRESGGWDAEQRRLRDNVSPAGLSLVDGIVEEIVEEQVLQIRLLAVRGSDVLEEDGPDNAATTPHQGNRWLVQLPAVFLGGLDGVVNKKSTFLHTTPWADGLPPA